MARAYAPLMRDLRIRGERYKAEIAISEEKPPNVAFRKNPYVYTPLNRSIGPGRVCRRDIKRSR